MVEASCFRPEFLTSNAVVPLALPTAGVSDLLGNTMMSFDGVAAVSDAEKFMARERVQVELPRTCRHATLCPSWRSASCGSLGLSLIDPLIVLCPTRKCYRLSTRVYGLLSRAVVPLPEVWASELQQRGVQLLGDLLEQSQQELLSFVVCSISQTTHHAVRFQKHRWHTMRGAAALTRVSPCHLAR